MKTLASLVLYVAIGALPAVVADNTVRDKCGHGMKDDHLFYTIVLWPAIPIIVAFSNYAGGEIQCRKETK